jgi:hypothetical protein
MESQSKQPKRMSQQVMRAIQALSRVVTLIFLLTLVLAIYQAFVTGNPLPIWAWLGIVVLFAVAVGSLVALIVYRGVVEQAGPLTFALLAAWLASWSTDQSASLQIGPAHCAPRLRW